MLTVFDIESTGLSGSYCDIIQFSYVQLNESGRIVKGDSMYFYHEGMHWDQTVCDTVHHIELDFLKQFKDKFEENVVKMYTVLSKADVVGHNAVGFDCPFVSQWLQRMGLPGLAFSSIRDTMKVFQPVTHTARIKLVKLCEVCGITPDIIRRTEESVFGTSTGQHNGNYDTIATALLTVRAMKEGYIQFGEQKATVSKAIASSLRVCDGVFLQTTSGWYKVDSDGAVKANNPPSELAMPYVLKATSPTEFEAMVDGSGVKLNIATGNCFVHMSGATLPLSGLTMPVDNFRKLLANLLGEAE